MKFYKLYNRLYFRYKGICFGENMQVYNKVYITGGGKTYISARISILPAVMESILFAEIFVDVFIRKVLLPKLLLAIMSE